MNQSCHLTMKHTQMKNTAAMLARINKRLYSDKQMNTKS